MPNFGQVYIQCSGFIKIKSQLTFCQLNDQVSVINPQGGTFFNGFATIITGTGHELIITGTVHEFSMLHSRFG